MFYIREGTYRISKLVQFPMLSGIVPVRLLPLTSLQTTKHKLIKLIFAQNREDAYMNQKMGECRIHLQVPQTG